VPQLFSKRFGSLDQRYSVLDDVPSIGLEFIIIPGEYISEFSDEVKYCPSLLLGSPFSYLDYSQIYLSADIELQGFLSLLVQFLFL
jgi:hypothetical protein